jgi:hypothetical protein
MKGAVLPNSASIVRLCGGSHVREDGTIAPTAFRAREDENYLSVNWLDFFAPSDRPAQIAAVRRALESKRNIGSKARLARLHVGSIHAVSSSGNAFVTLEVRHEPEALPPDPSHSGIYGTQPDDLAVQERLANLVNEVFSAKSAASQ